MSKLVIVLTGGGSGGHITPLIPLAHELKKIAPEAQLIYIGLKGEKTAADGRLAVFDDVYRIPAGKFRRYHGEGLWSRLRDLRTIGANGRDFFRLLAGSWRAWRLLKRLKPSVVFSKGGYVVVPVGLAARWRRIPIVTHDSDAVGGLANRIVGRWAKLRTTGQPASYYRYPTETVVYLGVPVDERVKPLSADDQADLKKQLKLPADAKVLLVAGGGQGARDVNNMVLAVAKQLLADAKLQIIHISGSANAAAVEAAYDRRLSAAQRQRLRVLGWVDDFYKYSGAADVVITRAGATTLAELAIQAKACIVIPSPFLAAGHQLKNAEALARRGAIEVVANNAPAKQLLTITRKLLNSQPRRRQLATKLAATAKPRATSRLAKLIVQVATGQVS